ncbi:MAG: hypothetical protein WBZ33_05000, partial [Thermoactinomyces sp.]
AKLASAWVCCPHSGQKPLSAKAPRVSMRMFLPAFGAFALWRRAKAARFQKSLSLQSYIWLINTPVFTEF